MNAPQKQKQTMTIHDWQASMLESSSDALKCLSSITQGVNFIVGEYKILEAKCLGMANKIKELEASIKVEGDKINASDE